MKTASIFLCMFAGVSAFAADAEQANPEAYLGSAENAAIVAQATVVTAQAVTAWPSESREDTIEIREAGDLRTLPSSSVAGLRSLLASHPTVPKAKYGCSPVFRVRLSFTHGAKKVDLLVLLGHGGFAVVDGSRPIAGRMHFPHAEEAFTAALLSVYTPEELLELRKVPNQSPEPMPLTRHGSS